MSFQFSTKVRLCASCPSERPKQRETSPHPSSADFSCSHGSTQSSLQATSSPLYGQASAFHEHQSQSALAAPSVSSEPPGVVTLSRVFFRKKHRKRRRKALRDGMLKRLTHARHVLGECDNGIAAHILRLTSWLHPIENPPQLLGNLHLTQSFWASLATVAELLAPWRKAPTADVLATATDLTWINKQQIMRGT